jgi:hypothetical protein
MNIAGYSPENRPSREEMEEIGRTLLASLSRYLDLELVTFAEHYVQEGSIVLTFRSLQPLHSPLQIQLEGVLLFDVRRGGLPPAVDAELLLFSCGKRMGLPLHRGKSYMQLTYDVTAGAWGELGWEPDAPEEWERVTEPRTSLYTSVKKTYDFEE